jgi:hypothetical protein
MTLAEAVRVMTERRNWLTARIAAKKSVGWDVEWDTRERDALTRGIEELQYRRAA